MSMLFSPLKVGQLELPNRIVIAPMCQYSAEDGRATDWHLIHLGQLAASGAALLIIEATAVAPEGRITPFDLGLYSDAVEDALGKVIRAVRVVSDIRLGLQLAHAGRKASSQAPWEGGALLSPAEGGWPTVAPSAVPHSPGEPPPAALDEGGLERIRQAFAQAAARERQIMGTQRGTRKAHGRPCHRDQARRGHMGIDHGSLQMGDTASVAPGARRVEGSGRRALAAVARANYL